MSPKTSWMLFLQDQGPEIALEVLGRTSGNASKSLSSLPKLC